LVGSPHKKTKITEEDQQPLWQRNSGRESTRPKTAKVVSFDCFYYGGKNKQIKGEGHYTLRGENDWWRPWALWTAYCEQIHQNFIGGRGATHGVWAGSTTRTKEQYDTERQF
jgi:hypothetical protein